MTAHARSRTSKQKTRRELASVLVTSALSNADNLQWDPFDSMTVASDVQPDGLLQRLLEAPGAPDSKESLLLAPAASRIAVLEKFPVGPIYKTSNHLRSIPCG